MENVDRRQLMFIHNRTPVECQNIDQLLLRPVAAQIRSKGCWRLVLIDFIRTPVIDWFGCYSADGLYLGLQLKTH